MTHWRLRELRSISSTWSAMNLGTLCLLCCSPQKWSHHQLSKLLVGHQTGPESLARCADRTTQQQWPKGILMLCQHCVNQSWNQRRSSPYVLSISDESSMMWVSPSRARPTPLIVAAGPNTVKTRCETSSYRTRASPCPIFARSAYAHLRERTQSC